MVRFKVWLARGQAETPPSFHPTMVRFKGGIFKMPAYAHLCFHPTMVRFKGGRDVGVGPIAPHVSIPLWCDLKCNTRVATSVTSAVSIPLWCDLKPQAGGDKHSLVFSFHPTMVRFKVTRLL